MRPRVEGFFNYKVASLPKIKHLLGVRSSQTGIDRYWVWGSNPRRVDTCIAKIRLYYGKFRFKVKWRREVELTVVANPNTGYTRLLRNQTNYVVLPMLSQ